MPTDTHPLYFVSFASADRRHPPLRERMDRFLADLDARVAVKYPPPACNSVSFFSERNIETGHFWSSDLENGLARSKVGLCLYSPSYFTSTWCGKEFQVFRQRSPGPAASGIIPVFWLPCMTVPPPVETIQFKDQRLPAAYAQVGIERLLALKVYSDEYELTVDAIADSIVAAAKRTSLTPMASVDLEVTPSAWDVLTAADPDSHTEGGIAKTCFVFAAKKGWDWVPYPDTPQPRSRTVGGMAQQISGELGLRYEEIPYDAQLSQKLAETNRSKVPTVLVADADSLLDTTYAAPLRDYDRLYLLNCGMLVPWDPQAKTAAHDPRWGNLQTRVAVQKIAVPPPLHEWRTVFSQEDLEASTRTIVERLRLRLLDQILTDSPVSPTPLAPQAGVEVRKAENQALSDAANTQGVRLESTPHLEVPNK
jgi:TIR domain